MSTDPQIKPIGVFDSGYGGLTVLKEIVSLMPEYDYLYLGDNARAPYGTRSFDTVYRYTLQAVKHLFDQGCELVILACNTASAKALRTIQQNDLPHLAPNKRVLGVIRPSTEIIDELSTSKEIGVLATSGTVKSQSYILELEKLHPHIKVHQQACPMWVPLVENNEFQSKGGAYFIKKEVEQLMSQSSNIDAIILGCTHYPILENEVKKYLPSNVKVFSQGHIVADRLKDYLKRHPEMEVRCSKNGQISFLTTENEEKFNQKASLFLGETVEAQYVELKED